MAETKIRSQDILDATVTDIDIAAANKDGLASLASLRTLGTGAQQAAAGNDSRFLPTDTVVVAGTRILANKLVGTDTYPAFRLFGDGKLEWGLGGASAPDMTLYHPSAGNLRTDGTIIVGKSIVVDYATSGGTDGLFFGGSQDTNLFRSTTGILQTDSWFRSNRTTATSKALGAYYGNPSFVHFQVLADGKLQWGPGNTDVDTTLYRPQGNTLMTTGAFWVGTDFAFTTNAGRVYFGAASDAYLYYAAAATLGTSGAFVIGGNVGFFAAAATTKKTVTGSRGGNAALASLLTALAAYGLIADSSTA